jgi:hypothetical protein
MSQQPVGGGNSSGGAATTLSSSSITANNNNPTSRSSSSTIVPSLLEDADSILREYLTWRGFSSTLQAFTNDLKDDFYSGLSSKRLCQKLTGDIEALKLDSIFVWWEEGIGPLLARVEEEVAATGRSLRDSTYRWYLVTCFKQQKIELITAFFKGKFNDLLLHDKQ